MKDEVPVILIIDDESMTRANVSDYLEDFGSFSVLTSPNGEDALSLMSSNKINLVLVDMRLPGMSGLEFIKTARLKWKDVVYIIHTGSTELAVIESLDELEIKDIDLILKPADLDVIGAHIVKKLSLGGN